jgi:hypothetical protein
VSGGELGTESEHLSDHELEALDRLVGEALARGDDDSLPALGYGEVSLVLAWPAGEPRFACKRLPVFPSRERFDAYERALADYLRALAEAGVGVVETELRAVELERGAVAGYVVQPILPPASLAPAVLGRSDPAAGHPLVGAVVETAAAVVGPRLGLDAQLANWTWDGEALTYIDVSTPLIWSADGRSRLDIELIAGAFPWLMRAPLRRFVAPGILDTYRELRGVFFDLCGNLLKQRLAVWLPAFLAAANRHLDEPISTAEVERYYRSDRRLWGTLLRIRRLDRAWQRHVRRRPYPFLLPGAIER